MGFRDRGDSFTTGQNPYEKRHPGLTKVIININKL